MYNLITGTLYGRRRNGRCRRLYLALVDNCRDLRYNDAIISRLYHTRHMQPARAVRRRPIPPNQFTRTRLITLHSAPPRFRN